MILPKRYLLLLLLGACLATIGYGRAGAQVIDSARLKPAGEGASVVDTTSSNNGEYVMTKNPTTAILYSIVPGGGQIYNEQYWKVPLFAGAAGYFIWRIIYYQNLFIGKAREADAAGRTSPLYSQLKSEREFYRDNRDLNAAYLLGVEILGMIDAYVGAHMFDFDVGEDISSRIYLTPTAPGIGLQMRW